MNPNYDYDPEQLYIRQVEIRARTGKLSPNVIRDLAVAGIQPVKVFGTWVFYRGEVEPWIEKQFPKQTANSVGSGG